MLRIVPVFVQDPSTCCSMELKLVTLHMLNKEALGASSFVIQPKSISFCKWGPAGSGDKQEITSSCSEIHCSHFKLAPVNYKDTWGCIHYSELLNASSAWDPLRYTEWTHSSAPRHAPGEFSSWELYFLFCTFIPSALHIKSFVHLLARERLDGKQFWSRPEFRKALRRHMHLPLLLLK